MAVRMAVRVDAWRGHRAGTGPLDGAAYGVVDLDGPAAAGLSPDLQAHIGRELRAAYQRIVEEPVPDRFLALLESLAKGGG